MKYKQVLENIGFSNKEIYVYTALLELDTATPTQVSKKTDLNRSSCYDVLDILVKRGLVSKLKKNKKIYFHAGDPRELFGYLEREKSEAVRSIDKKKKLVEEALPELLTMLNPSSTRPKVELFEGAKGVREAYEDTLTADGVYYAYANFETMHEGLPNFFPEYYERRVKAGILGRGIFSNNEINRKQFLKNKEEMREGVLLLNKDEQFTPEIIIYNDKMLIVSWKEKLAVRIESRELVHLQKIIFEQLYGFLDPKNKGK